MLLHRIVIAVFSVIFLSSANVGHAEEMSGRQIMDEVADRQERPYEYEVQSMVLTDKGGSTEKRQLRRYVRKGEDGNFKYLIVFHDPAGVRGVALLTWQNKDKDDDQFLYLPSMGKKMKRIAKGGKRNYFMGTDFSFEDLILESRDKFRYTKLPNETIDGQEHFVIDAEPEDKELRTTTGYKSRRLWIRKDIFFIVRIDYFDRRGRYIKRQISEDLKQVDGKTWRAEKITVDNEKEKQKTAVDISSRSFAETDVPSEKFRQRFVTSGKHIR
jgi:hypothetical protein